MYRNDLDEERTWSWGVIGNTEKPQTMATWVYSQDAVMTLIDDLRAMRNLDVDQIKMHHKEESTSRIKKDEADRKSLKQALVMFIDPLDPSSHKGGQLLNIITGKIAHSSVNVDSCVKLGNDVLDGFEKSWPEGF